MFYTHSKVIAIFIICLAVIVSTLIYKKQQNFKQETKVTEIKTQIARETELDSDGDGLKDWEESLLGFDPNKKDTDGDGTDDSNEKNDQFVFTQKNTESDNPPENTSMTENFAKSFFTNYLYAKQNNTSLTADQITQIANNATENVAMTKPVPFDINDIKISKNQTKQQYEKEIDTAFFSATIKKQENEMQIAQNAIKSGNRDELKKLDPIIDSYQKVVDETLKVVVPEDNVGLHLVYLNTINSLKEDIKNLKYILDDPLKSYIYLNSYELNAQKISIIMIKMSDYFSKK